jgi:hypothetical protein
MPTTTSEELKSLKTLTNSSRCFGSEGDMFLHPMKLSARHYDLMGFEGRYEAGMKLYRYAFDHSTYPPARKILNEWNDKFALLRLRGTR